MGRRRAQPQLDLFGAAAEVAETDANYSGSMMRSGLQPGAPTALVAKGEAMPPASDFSASIEDEKLEVTERAAVFSDDYVYRYLLSRAWSPAPRALWILHNPSDAGVDNDDPTVRRVIGFTQRFGCGGFELGNVHAFIATEPDELWAARWDLRVGPDNDRHLREALARCLGPIVVGWGRVQPPAVNRELVRARVAQVLELLRDSGRGVFCLGTNADGSPQHPLYLPNSRRLELYTGGMHGRHSDDAQDDD